MHKVTHLYNNAVGDAESEQGCYGCAALGVKFPCNQDLH